MDERSVAVDIESTFDEVLGMYTLTAVHRVTHAIVATKIVSADEVERLREASARRGDEPVEPVAFIEEVLGPWTRQPEIVGCVHMTTPNAMCGPCGRKELGLDPGLPEYRRQ